MLKDFLMMFALWQH